MKASWKGISMLALSALLTLAAACAQTAASAARKDCDAGEKRCDLGNGEFICIPSGDTCPR